MPLRLNPALRSFWTTKASLKVLKGGRMSSKTHDAAGFAIYLARNYSIRFLCIRQFQARISESVYKVLVDKIYDAGWEDEFIIIKSLENAIVHKETGSSFSFYGMARNTAEIKGFEGADICWIEECEALTFEQWKIIKPTVRRKSGSEIWLIYNPRLVSDFVEQSPIFRHDPNNGTIVRQINYDENPFLPPDVIRDIENDKRLLEEDEFEHIYLGLPMSDDDNVIIKRSWIMAAIDAHKKLPDLDWFGVVRSGFDVADSGKDKCANVEMDGCVCNFVDEWKAREDELLKSSARVYSRALGMGAFVRYDSIGVGAGVGAHFNEMNEERQEKDRKFVGIGFEKFNAGAKVIDPDEFYINNYGKDEITNAEFFSNLKAQAWWLVADRFRNTYNAVKNGMEFDVNDLISIDSDVDKVEQLITELSTPNRSFDKSGRVKVESKEELAKREVPSPNIADAFIMANAPKEGGLTLFDVL